MNTDNEDRPWTTNEAATPIEGPSNSTVVVATRFVVVWASPEAVRSYGSAPAHAKAMCRTEHWASESQVERWRTSGSEVPTLVDIAKRFGHPAPRRGLVRPLRPAPSPRTIGSNHPQA